MKKIILTLIIISFLFLGCNPPIQINTVNIGTQEWCTENLDVETFKNGDPITHAQTNEDWEQAAISGTPAWCYYNNDPTNGDIYGKLYNWYAVNDPRGLAPDGYHIPNDFEWNTLINYLGGQYVAGGKMKSTGIQYWLSPNTYATNSSGFSGLPGGNRNDDGTFYQISIWGYWWSYSDYSTDLAWLHYLFYNGEWVWSSYQTKGKGLSVRCIKD
jgi:uncharacterized protein (TIGR02145 family)